MPTALNLPFDDAVRATVILPLLFLSVRYSSTFFFVVTF